MLSLSRWSAGYGGTRIVDDVTLDIPDGELVALLGRNGMGKTTLLRSIFGLATTMGGSLRLDDADLPARPEALARRGFTLLPDDRGVFPTLTVEENLDLARRRGYTPTVDVLSLFRLLTARARLAAGSLSGGQKQQLGLARAILAGRRFIAIDEFSQGLQPSIAQAALSALREVAQSGVGVLIVEQGPELPLNYADRIVGMVKGRIVFDERTDDLRKDPSPLTDLLVIS
jgi:ABC-type branched-subunit amino acid transport system ATPase component